MKKTLSILMVLLIVMSTIFANGEQEATEKWPTQPIHIVGQSAAGSGPDLFVRQLQPALQKELGTSIVVENKAGSGGKLAADYVWKSAPDGYTLFAHSSPLTTVTQISKKADFSIKDMKHIVVFDSTPYAVIVKADSPINTIQDLIKYAQNNKASNANSGIGGAMFLQSRIMAEALGIDYSEVPYNGSQPCTLAVMNGDTTFTVTAYDVAMNNDQVKVVCILGDKRVGFLPDVATVVEQGFTFPFLTMKRGIIAPPETSDDVAAKLIEAFKVALNDPAFLEYAKTSGVSLDIAYGDNYKKIDDQYYTELMKFTKYL